MNDKRLTNHLKLLSCWYAATNLQPTNPATDGLRYMDAAFLSKQLGFKPRVIYKLTQQLLDNHEITEVSKSYQGSGKGSKAYSRLYKIDRDIIENYVLLIQMKYHHAAYQIALLPHSRDFCGENQSFQQSSIPRFFER